MTNPTISYGHGHLDDCSAVSGYTQSNGGLSAITCTSDGDTITITATTDAAADEWVRYYNTTALAVSTTTYNKYIIRYKTSVAEKGLGARVIANYVNDPADFGDYDYILGASAPAFSTSWTTITGSLDTGKTLYYLYFIADDYPDGNGAGETPNGAYSVYFDFILIHEGTFTFPFIAPGGLRLNIQNQYADLPIPARVGNITQYMGMNSPEVTIEGEVDESTSWHGNSMDLGWLYYLFKWAHQEPFQWFTSDLINCKVTPRNLEIMQQSDGKPKRYSINLKQYSLLSGTNSTWASWSWFGK